MTPTDSQGPLTAGDLMTADVKTFGTDLPLREAARQLARLGLRGVPVVDPAGRCVGVLSVSDLARWAAGRDRPGLPLPLTCTFQEPGREPGGRERVHCLLAEGVCPFQRVHDTAAGADVVCSEPHCVPTDWQVVVTEAAPMTVGDVMTTEVVGVGPDARVAEMARLMLDRGVHRLIVLDAARRPVGVVAANELLQVLAHAEFAGAVGSP